MHAMRDANPQDAITSAAAPHANAWSPTGSGTSDQGQVDRLCTGDEYGIGLMVRGMLPNQLAADFDRLALRGDLTAVHR